MLIAPLSPHARRTQRFALVLALALALAACGGSGEGTTESSLARPAPKSDPAQQVSAQPATERDTKAARDNGEGQTSVAGSRATNLYIVQMAENPAAAYTGDMPGFAATKPGRDKKLDPDAPHVASYVGMLKGKHDAMLSGKGRKAHSYVYSFNGFAAELSDADAAAMAASPGVLSVVKNEFLALDTASTPAFLGLSGAGGFWNRTGAKGENVIIGVVDGGAWPEHPSLSDRTGTNGNDSQDGKLGYRNLPTWKGKCQVGDNWTGTHCNQKLIGARYYNEGYGGNAGITRDFPWEFNSPRDFGGHGTHTATTAGGNEGVAATGDAAPFGTVSGIAPRARIAVYKSCWETGQGGTCATVDSLAAIDQAVADGVDVINYSISGSRTNLRDPVAIAFLFAADAGVFVAASAGNSGPTTSTVAHPGPWMTTVANGTHNRTGATTLTLGDGRVLPGASLTVALPSTALVDAANVAASGVAVADAARCFPGSLNPAAVQGKVVLCLRGSNALVEKSQTVALAGGVGAILYNDPAGATNTLALTHDIPTVHVVAASGLAIKAYIASLGSGATVSFQQATLQFDVPAPLTSASSSRGPLIAGGGDLLKPDIIAPGSDILAGVAPPGNGGRLFALYSGTSMSSPHVAGMAALFKELKPGWSPMAIKSALMTSAGDVLDGPNTNPLVIFRQGAGHAQPNSAVDPGVVYDSNFADWIALICKAQPGGGCTGVTPVDVSDMNTPSIAIGDMPGLQTVTRRVTNVSGKKLTLTPSVSGMLGITTTVSPTTLELGVGETKAYTVSFARTTAVLGAYTGGQLTWTSNLGHRVRSPMVVRPLAMAAPAEVTGNYSVTFGYNGPFSVTPRGLIPAAVTAGTVADDPTDGSCTLASPGATIVPVTVPAGTTYARFSTFDVDSPGVDIDLCVFNAAGTQVGGSGSGTSAEEANLFAPPAGDYRVVIHGWQVGAGSAFKLHTWLLGTTNAGNMSVSAPTTATLGGTGNVALTFSALTAGQKYLGSLAYGGTATLPNPTIVRVDP